MNMNFGLMNEPELSPCYLRLCNEISTNLFANLKDGFSENLSKHKKIGEEKKEL
jgi:hypothetical protein